jgi:hypothetical protein
VCQASVAGRSGNATSPVRARGEDRTGAPDSNCPLYPSPIPEKPMKAAPSLGCPLTFTSYFLFSSQPFQLLE